MSKWFGKIGLVQTVETEPSIFEEKVTEHDCYGELLKNARRVQTADKVNDDLTIANTLSILADRRCTSTLTPSNMQRLWVLDGK